MQCRRRKIQCMPYKCHWPLNSYRNPISVAINAYQKIVLVELKPQSDYMVSTSNVYYNFKLQRCNIFACCIWCYNRLNGFNSSYFTISINLNLWLDAFPLHLVLILTLKIRKNKIFFFMNSQIGKRKKNIKYSLNWCTFTKKKDIHNGDVLVPFTFIFELQFFFLLLIFT